jgi:hypothetical protein
VSLFLCLGLYVNVVLTLKCLSTAGHALVQIITKSRDNEYTRRQ